MYSLDSVQLMHRQSRPPKGIRMSTPGACLACAAAQPLWFTCGTAMLLNLVAEVTSAASAAPSTSAVAAAPKEENLDDLVRTLLSQISSTDWLSKQVPTGERLWGPDAEEEPASDKK